MRKSSLVGVAGGLAESSATAILGSVLTGAVGAGTTQATALVLANSTTVFATVAAGSGAILPPRSDLGDEIFVANLGANALLVYPTVGAAIQTGAVNAGFSVAAGKSAKFKRATTALWLATLSA